MKTFALFAAAAAVTVMADAGDSNKAAPKKPFELPEWGSHDVCDFDDKKLKAKPKAKLTEQYCGSVTYCRLFDDKAKLDKLIAEQILEVAERYNNATECRNARENAREVVQSSTSAVSTSTEIARATGA